MKFKSIILFCFAAFAFTACFKDKGNYNYDNTNTKFVDTEASASIFAQQSVVQQNAVCSIAPVFMNGVDPTKLVYEWRLTKNQSVPDPATGKFTDSVLSTSQNLNVKMAFDPGSYMLRLHIWDPANKNVAQIINTPFTVSSFAMQGLMLLHGGTDSCDVSIVVNKQLNSLWVRSDTVQKDIFSFTNGIRIAGQAKMLGFMNHGTAGADSRVNVFTTGNPNNSGYRTGFGALKITDTYKGMFDPVNYPYLGGFQTYATNGTNEVIVDGGNAYYQGQTQPVGFMTFNIRSYASATSYPVADSYCAMDIDNASAFNANKAGVIYDKNVRNFKLIQTDNTVGAFSSNPLPPTGSFSCSSTGKFMVYGEQGYSPSQLSPYFSRYHYYIVSDVTFSNPISATPNTRKILIADWGRLPDPNFPTDVTKSMALGSNLRAKQIDTLRAMTAIESAKYFAFGSKGDFMYYATDTTVYMSSPLTGTPPVIPTSTVWKNFSADPTYTFPNYVITAIQVFKVKGHPNDGSLLYVALYNPGMNQSTLLQYPINPINGQPTGTAKAYTGIAGKIGVMAYKPI